jgi:hypothetical protein
MMVQTRLPVRLPVGDAALVAAPLRLRNFAKTSVDGRKRAWLFNQATIFIGSQLSSQKCYFPDGISSPDSSHARKPDLR